MFACAHPAIDAGIRAPLILQTILGFDAATVASAFLVAPATMGQRLVRAKQKIALAGIPFQLPERTDLPERLGAVLEAIYATFAEGWSDPAGTEARRRNLAEEGIWLGRLVASLLPEEPEALGLLALMLYADARRAARRDAHGDYVPLAQQDTTLWHADLIAEAEALLRTAGAKGNSRPLSAGGRDPVRSRGAAADRSRRLGRDRAAVWRPCSADRIAGGGDQPGDRGRRNAGTGRRPRRA
jgi:RNA polymerase sigma-70 factor, ECF subfamily